MGIVTLAAADRKFIDEVIAFGAEGIKKCFNCGTCTAICPISEDVTTSFRKAIRYVQLGLKEKVLQTPVLWMCAECRECVAECPRNANPSQIMAALRRYAVSSYSWYGIVKNLIISPTYAALIALVPTVLLLSLAFLVGKVESNVIKAGFKSFIPLLYVDAGGIAIGIIVLLSIIYSLRRFSKLVGAEKIESEGFGGSLSSLLKEVLVQLMLYKCRERRDRWAAHMMVVWGFIGAAITTISIFIFGLETPLALTHPVKLLGNLAAILLIVGGTILLVMRISDKEQESSYYDWFFLLLIYIVAWTGLLTEITRFMNSFIAYPLYLIHLITVAILLVLAPYTKFAHSIYRPLTAFFGRMKGWRG